MTRAISAGGTHFDQSASGIDSAVRGGVDHARQHGVAAHAVVAVLGVQGLDEGEHGGLRGHVAGRARERPQRRSGRHADEGAAAALGQAGHRRPCQAEGRPEVEAKLLLEVLRVGLVDLRAGGEAAHQVDHRRKALDGGDSRLRGVGIGQVGLDQREAVALLDAVPLPGNDPRRGDRVARVEEVVDDRRAERSGASRNEHRVRHVRCSRPTTTSFPMDPIPSETGSTVDHLMEQPTLDTAQAVRARPRRRPGGRLGVRGARAAAGARSATATPS